MKRYNHFYLLIILILWIVPLNAVVVSSTKQLADAVSNANSGGDTEIILQDGTYTLDDMLMIWADGVTVRSQSGNRNKVTIRGEGMYGGVSHIFNVAGTGFTARDMTIGWVANHAIQIWGNNNSGNTMISNLRIVDTYEQMVKISYDPANSNSSRNGVMQNCLLEYSAGIGPQYYIGGIDGHRCINWIVRNNTFKNISSPDSDVAEHAVHFWSDSQGTLVENNLIINCDRGIGFGLGTSTHVGGIIRNNMIYHSSADPGFADVAIGLESASNAKVYNNTIYMANSYPNAIEYRFPGTSGGIIKNNLCNKAITLRDGGSADLSHNLTNAQSAWFVNVAGGDLHLASAVAQVVDQGTAITGLTTDYDGDTRPQGAGIDIGADEYKVSTPASLTVTSPNGGESWKVGSVHPVTWTSTGTVGNVRIRYSTNNGGTWATVVSTTANDGTYSWTIPNAVSNQCLVRISEAADNNPVDTSNAVFSIVSAGTDVPIIDLNRDQLLFGAAANGTVTGEQILLVENTGKGTLEWEVSSDSAWLDATPSSGEAPGVIRASVTSTGLAPGTYTGTLSISDPDAANSPQEVTVTLTVYPSAGTSAPFGDFSTPEQGSTVSSSIPVTGWVLDDIEVVSVQIFNGTAYVGDAVLVEGARPDVEQLYPGYPKNYQAGWGYMMLTNFLPNGGNGTYTLYATALDAEGHQVTLGSKTITCDNAHAVKPFGAIDTPAQGGKAAGSNFINWGWVLTPQPNRIPTNGTTINVYVDGVNLGHPLYNLNRSDVASLFPGYANSNGAGGKFSFDTTAYENGIHTIHWEASDNAGNIDGIGSRFFTILNEGSSRLMESGQEGLLPPAALPGAKLLKKFDQNFLLPFGHCLSPGNYPVRVVRGYSPDSPQLIYPGEEGIININTRELERVEVHLGLGAGDALESCQLSADSSAGAYRAYTGYLVVGECLKPLPIGSFLDRQRGVFYWGPGPGFVGKYPLVFIDKVNNCLIRVDIKISPKF